MPCLKIKWGNLTGKISVEIVSFVLFRGMCGVEMLMLSAVTVTSYDPVCRGG